MAAPIRNGVRRWIACFMSGYRPTEAEIAMRVFSEPPHGDDPAPAGVFGKHPKIGEGAGTSQGQRHSTGDLKRHSLPPRPLTRFVSDFLTVPTFVSDGGGHTLSTGLRKKKYAELSDKELFPIAWQKYRNRLSGRPKKKTPQE